MRRVAGLRSPGPSAGVSLLGPGKTRGFLFANAASGLLLQLVERADLKSVWSGFEPQEAH